MAEVGTTGNYPFGFQFWSKNFIWVKKNNAMKRKSMWIKKKNIEVARHYLRERKKVEKWKEQNTPLTFSLGRIRTRSVGKNCLDATCPNNIILFQMMTRANEVKGYPFGQTLAHSLGWFESLINLINKPNKPFSAPKRLRF